MNHISSGRSDSTTENGWEQAGQRQTQDSADGTGRTLGEGNVNRRRIGEALFIFSWTSGRATTESVPMDVLSFDEVQEMTLEQMESPVDLLVELELLGQQEEGTDATGSESPHAIGRFIVDIGRGHHGYGPFGPGGIGQTLVNSPSGFLEESLLACDAFFPDNRIHSKAPLC